MTISIKKIRAIAIFAFIMGLFAFIYASSISSNTLGLQFVVNNTNLAPTFPGEPVGTGERLQNVTYWANNTPIEIFVFAHANALNSTLSINLSINGTVVEYDQRRPIASATNSNAYIHAIIPQYSSYMVNITNYHHYEWREYTILTGNVTTNITTSGSGGGCTGNCSFDNLSINALSKNDTTDTYGPYINLTTDFSRILTGVSQSYMGVGDGSYVYGLTQNSVTGVFSRIFVFDDNIDMDVSNGTATEYLQTDNEINLTVDGNTYSFNNSALRLNESNITGVNNLYLNGGGAVWGFNDSGNPSANFFNNLNAGATSTVFRAIRNGLTSTQFYGFSGTTITGAIHRFSLRVATGNITNQTQTYSGQQAQFDFQGSANGSFNTASTRIETTFTENGATGRGATMDLYATSNGGTLSKFMTGYGNQTINVPALAGVGNAYVCVNSAGTLYRGSPGC